jgi:hypothetical protein
MVIQKDIIAVFMLIDKTAVLSRRARTTVALDGKMQTDKQSLLAIPLLVYSDLLVASGRSLSC